MFEKPQKVAADLVNVVAGEVRTDILQRAAYKHLPNSPRLCGHTA